MSIEAMNEAREVLEDLWDGYMNVRDDQHYAVLQWLRRAIEQERKQKPVAFMDDKGHIFNSTTNPELYTPLYTAPPPREWVWLKDDEMENIWNTYCDEMGNVSISDSDEIFRAVEAKLRENNA